MPEVKCLYNLCADKPIYEISNYTLFGCKVNPNIITGINLFLITPLILYNFIYNGSYIILFGLILIRVYLDILDGHIARRCKLQSRFGAMFDLFGDIFLIFSLSLIVIYYIYYFGHSNYALSMIALLIVIYLYYKSSAQMYKEIILLKNNKKNNRLMTTMDTIVADNSIILSFLGIFVIKIFINYLSSFNK
jgi:phosphatidylglycerophosphate synthase